jgi:alcohol dehydrogenase (cytochrome c)
VVGFALALATFVPQGASGQDGAQSRASNSVSDAPAGNSQTPFRPLTQAMLNDPDPADWVMWRGGYANWGYSPLDQITADNVNELRLAWSWAFAPAGPGSTGMQVEPIVYDGVMYLRHANERYSAHDATTGDVIWEYSRPIPEEITSGEAVFTVHRGRGVFLFEDRLIGHSTDGMLFALDPRTGELVWETEMTDFRDGQQPSGAPVVFNGAIAVPYNCTAWSAPGPCHMSAYDVESGEVLWRWYTSPTRDDATHDSWGADPQVYPLESRRNMSPWQTPAVDTERGLFIFGLGSSAPQQPELAGTDGLWPDRLYNGSTVALEARTGELVWWAQHHTDMWNNDATYDRILVDSPVTPDPPDALGVNPDIRPGEMRELVIGSFSKDAIFYAYDRSDGEFLYARPTAYQNVIQGYDGRTGAFITNPDAVMTADADRERTICRENRQIPQGAYSPLTNAYYVPAFNGRCSVIRVTTLSPSLETGYNTSTVRYLPNPVSHLGQPEAIDVSTGKTLWRLDREAPLYGMLTTGGGLLFAADTNRRFYALDQWTGEIVWRTILNGVSDMAPITYSVDGRQYIAVISPGGTVGSASHVGQLRARVPIGQRNVGHTLFVFALPEE